jgi:DNA replication and repair protein RecF
VLASIEVENFRCIQHAELELDRRGTGIVGPNAAGKTSLLEAIYYLGHGRSFRTNTRARLIGPATPYFRVVGKLNVGGRQMVGGAEFVDGKTHARLAGEGISSISQIAEVLPIQVIDPGVHRLIEEGSARRRQMMDWGVFHVKHEFLFSWRRYQRALSQRNSALRSAMPAPLVRSWDADLIGAGSSIDGLRAEYTRLLAPAFTSLAERLLSVPAEVAYQRGWDPDTDLGAALAESSDRDARLKTTTVGPHRADVIFKVGGSLARDRVSRGQQKMLAAAFVLAQIEVGAPNMPEPTCLLLDDPAAELDVDNLGKVLKVIETIPAQLVVTSLNRSGLNGMGIAKTFHVEQGRFAPMI